MSSLTNVTTQSSRGRSTSSNVQDQDQDSVERLRLRSLAEECDKFILEVLLHTLPSGGSRISQTLGWPIPDMGAKPNIWQDFVKKRHENERNWTAGRPLCLFGLANASCVQSKCQHPTSAWKSKWDKDQPTILPARTSVSRCVTPEVNLRNQSQTGDEQHKRRSTLAMKPCVTSPEVQNTDISDVIGNISGPTKRTRKNNVRCQTKSSVR